MSYVAEALVKVVSISEATQPQMYWRPLSYSSPIDWQDTDYPDGNSFHDVSDYEYIAYSPLYIYVWVIYDCYTGSFYKLPRNPDQLSSDIHCVEAG